MDMKDQASTQIAWRLRDLHHMHRNHMQLLLEKHQLFAGQPRILLMVAKNRGATQKEIATAMNVSPASLSVSLKRMEKAGLLTRKHDQDDLRSNHIELTEMGERIFAAGKASIMSLDEQMVSGFSADELVLLKSYLDRMYQNLTAGKGVTP